MHTVTGNRQIDKIEDKKKHSKKGMLIMIQIPDSVNERDSLSIPAATAAAAPSAVLAAVSGAIATSVAASVSAPAAAAAVTVVAALPGGAPLPSTPVSTVVCVGAAAITQPCSLVKAPLVASAAGAAAASRAAVSAFPPRLTPLGWEAASPAVSASTITSTVAASTALVQRAASGSSVASVAIAPGALPSWRMRSLARGSFFRSRCNLL